MMTKQKNIAQVLERDPSEISRFLSGKRRASWSLAKQLSSFLPAKTIDQWKDSTPDDLRTAFNYIVNITPTPQQSHSPKIEVN